MESEQKLKKMDNNKNQSIVMVNSKENGNIIIKKKIELKMKIMSNSEKNQRKVYFLTNKNPET